MNSTKIPEVKSGAPENQNAYCDENAEVINQSNGTYTPITDCILSIAGCINILLIGKAGSGKSTVGNIISGGVNFKVAPTAQLVTTKCQEAKVSIKNVLINIVDTPGLFNLEINNCKVQEMITEYLKTNRHLFPLILVLCIQDGVRFTKEDESVLDRIKGNFGTHVLQNVIVVFTGKMPTIDMPEMLKQFLKEINNITFHFPTDSRAPERDQERESFVGTCQKLLNKPKNLNYNLSDYEAAQRHIEERDVRKFQRLQSIQNNPKLSSVGYKKRKSKCRLIHKSRKT
ncbi:GTPase IMAP family member 4-like [Mytilus trossulus]|uniref:GTPase IMAP family member 4-like n=1 Tax=Mytilus trossulus TaxID=6551 RepID=UPI0030041F9F